MPGRDRAGTCCGQATGDGSLRGGEPAGPLRRGDVVGEDMKRAAGRFVGDDQGHLDRDLMAVGVPGGPLHPLIPGPARPAGGQRRQFRSARLAHVGRHDQFLDRSTVRLRLGVSERCLGGRVPRHHPAAGVEGDIGVHRGGENCRDMRRQSTGFTGWWRSR
jgi:hypothetical protein